MLRGRNTTWERSTKNLLSGMIDQCKKNQTETQVVDNNYLGWRIRPKNSGNRKVVVNEDPCETRGKKIRGEVGRGMWPVIVPYSIYKSA